MPNVSPHFQHYNATNEQNLIQDLVDESIYQRGLEIVYIPRSQDNIDYLYNEDPSQYYDSFKLIAVYPLFVDGFDGQELMSMFGNEFQKSGTFIMSKRKWAEIFPEYPLPREGDLIYMPVTNAILEIKYVEQESPFFEKGKQYVYELKTEAFEFSYENISTGNTEVDDIVADEIDVLNQDTNTEGYGDNDDIANDTSDDIDFDPDNPFGVR
jgi:hypothetical protein